MVGTDEDFAVQAERDPQTDHEVVLLDVDGHEVLWHVFTRQVVPPDPEMMGALGDAWAGVEAVHVQAAVTLDGHGRPDYATVYPLNVYFPTEERTELPLMLQADPPDLDRQFVARTPQAQEYNSWLTSELGRLVGEVVALSLAASFVSSRSSS